MLKRILLVFVVFAIIIALLQVFGGRDFTQIGLAWDKYQQGGKFGDLASDIGVIFAGGKVKEGVLPSSQQYNKIIYRWKDEMGVTHVSERKPNVDNYEEIRVGDMDFQIEKGLSKEEMEQVLNKKGGQ